MRGRFITLEGIDGAGKSTHLETIAQTIRSHGNQVLTTREPGGTPLGEKLRALILDQEMGLETETLLMFAARREHLERVILPALDAGVWVVCDRFTDATFAYQGGGRGLAQSRIARLADWVHPNFAPDLTVLFDAAPEIAAKRLAGAPGHRDRFEQEDREFFARVRATYLALAASDPRRFILIDATGEQSAISKMIQDMLLTRC